MKTYRRALVFVGFIFSSNLAFAQFTEIPVPNLPEAVSGSVAWGDYDGDGHLDFLLSGSLKISLWRSTGSGFTNVTATAAPDLPGLYDSAADWGDFDNDGRLDLLITGLTNFSGGSISQIWRNTESGFINVPVPGLPGVAESAVTWTDFDGDGRLDFLIAGSSNGISSGAIAQLWRNTGTAFTNVPIPDLPGAYFGSLAVADFDNDGRPDFLITGITNSSTGGATAQLWRNTGNAFTNVPVSGLRGVYVSSAAWGDFDNDGLLDFILEGLSGNGFISEIWRNTGNGFTNVPVAGLPGIADGSLACADFDNDGRLDFLITGLTNGVTEISQLWRNTGAGFINIPVPDLPGSFDNALGWADFDNDSRLDFLIAGTINSLAASQLWRNTGSTSNSPPAAPTGLSAIVSDDTVRLLWDLPADDHTPASGLSYNVRIGITPGGSEIASAPALPDGKLLLPRMGSARNGTATFRKLIPGGTYFWSVQAVDTTFVGSAFAAEQRFTVGALPVLVNSSRQTNGVFEFDFTNRTVLNFDVLVSTDATLPLTNWTNLGPATSLGASLFRFTDTAAIDLSQRFYLLRQQ